MVVLMTLTSFGLFLSIGWVLVSVLNVLVPWIRRRLSRSNAPTVEGAGTPASSDVPSINVVIDEEKKNRLESEVDRIRRSIVDQGAGKKI